MSADGQRTKWRRNIAENFNRLSRCTNVTDRQTDGRHIASVNVSSRSLKSHREIQKPDGNILELLLCTDVAENVFLSLREFDTEQLLN